MRYQGEEEGLMIINTGQRTDIPAFYAKWFAGRLKEGYVCVRNPFNHQQVSRYRLDPSVVDVIGFCTKNPAPMFPYMDLLRDYGQYWYVTITPYGRDIEPHVPDKHRLLEDFRQLSETVGKHRIGWRYDPIFLSEIYKGISSECIFPDGGKAGGLYRNRGDQFHRPLSKGSEELS